MEVEYLVSIPSLVLPAHLYKKFLLYIGDGSTALKSLPILNGKVVTSISSNHLYAIYVSIDDGNSYEYTTLLYYYGGNTNDMSTLGCMISCEVMAFGNLNVRFRSSSTSNWTTITTILGDEYGYSTKIYQLF